MHAVNLTVVQAKKQLKQAELAFARVSRKEELALQRFALELERAVAQRSTKTKLVKIRDRVQAIKARKIEAQANCKLAKKNLKLAEQPTRRQLSRTRAILQDLLNLSPTTLKPSDA